MSNRIILLTTVAAAGLALAACNKTDSSGGTQPVTGAPIASLPLATAAPPPETAAPLPQALPAAPPIVRVAHPSRPVYSYVDAAYQLNDAFADSPPDYSVDYEGEAPWVWRSGNGEYRVAEDTPDGERFYYYRGNGEYPFYVRDPRYGYAYDDDGELVEVYDSYGRPYPNYGEALTVIAAQYLFRGRGLRYAAAHDQRRAAYAGDWRARRDDVLLGQQRWREERDRNTEWRQVHDQRAQQDQQRFAAVQQERAQRQAYAQRVAPVITSAPIGARPAPPPMPGPGGRNIGRGGPPPGAQLPGGPPPGGPGFDRDHQRFNGQPGANPEQVRQQQAAQQQQARTQEAQQHQQDLRARDQQAAQQQQAQRTQQAQQHQQDLRARDQQQAHDQQQRAAQQQDALRQQHQAQAQQQTHEAQQHQAEAGRAQADAQRQAQQQHQAEAQARQQQASQHQAEAQAHQQQAAQHQAEAQQHAAQAAQHQAEAQQHAAQPHPAAPPPQPHPQAPPPQPHPQGGGGGAKGPENHDEQKK